MNSTEFDEEYDLDRSLRLKRVKSRYLRKIRNYLKGLEMIDWLVNRLFWLAPLRNALLAEATFYNSLTRVMRDPEAMKTASAFWDEGDGWRGWTIEGDKYYFNDVPEHDLMGVIESLEEMAK